MDQQESILKFKQMGYTPVSKIKNGVVLKSDAGIVMLYADGNYEGFSKKSVNENIINELKMLEKLGLLVLIGLSTIYFTTDITIVSGQSMVPTYKNHQLLVRSKTTKDVNKMMVSKNTIIKFKSPNGDTCIKRVFGLPGDDVEFDMLKVLINGKVVDDGNVDNINKFLKPGEKPGDRLNNLHKKTGYKLKPGQYFVMGDNRDFSDDSRKYGPIAGINIISILEK